MKHTTAKKNIYTKIFWLLACFLLIILIAVVVRQTRNHSVSRPVIQQPTIEHLEKNQPTILFQYTLLDAKPDYNDIAYRPRAFKNNLSLDDQTVVSDVGIYAGWDVLNTQDTNQRLKIDLNRPVIIAIVWRGSSIPTWLTTWEKNSVVKINGNTYPVYKKIITKSNIEINTTNAPIILFAEQNGTPSKPPSSPQGLAIPIPNASCPDWVHEEFKARGPDGKLYPTWHPQIDPIYWCYFNHEHGSNPTDFDSTYRIPFGYAGNAMGMHEAHVGYKVYVWDDNYGHLWLALQHQGTSTNQAACGSTHELDILAKDKNTGEIVSEQYFVGNYGASKPIVTSDMIKPSSCPNQANIEKGNLGARYLPVKDHGAVMEEPWTVDNQNILGFNFASFTVTTYDPVRMCTDITCDNIVYTGATGTNHALSYVTGFGPKSGIGHSGIFYTDPSDKKIVAKNSMGAIRQYIKPGISINSTIPYTSTSESSCRDIYGTGGIMQCGKGLSSVSTARENGIKIPN